MDATHFLQIFLAVTGFILTSTLLILAYFIKKWIESVETLADTVTALKEAFVEQKATHSSFSERYSLHHKNFETKIEELQEQISDNTHRIEQNSMDIAALKAKKRG